MMHALPDPGPEEATASSASAPTAAASSAPSSLALIPTVVLSKASAPAKKKHALLASIAQLPLKVHIHTAPPAVAPNPAIAPHTVSSSAKTQDLKLRAAASNSASRAKTPPTLAKALVAPAKPQSLPQRILPRLQAVNGRSEGTAKAVPQKLPRLVAKAEAVEFQLSATSVVVGRSNNPADGVNIDLSSLKRGSDRVSRRHAEIVKRGADYFIRDLGSLNGTYIGGRGRLGRDQLYKLNDRDQVVFGGATFEFRKG